MDQDSSPQETPQQPSAASQATKQVASTATKEIGKQVSGKVAEKLATQAGGKAAAAALANAIPGAGQAISAAIMAAGALSKALGLNKNSAAHLAAMGGMAGVGLGVAAGSGALAAAGLALGAGSVALGGVGALGAAAGAVAGGIMAGVSAIVGIVLTAAGIGALTLTVFTVLAFFIINSGAHIVPVGSTVPFGDGGGGGGHTGPGGAYPMCWPTNGTISQGPLARCGECTHSAVQAIDIAGTLGQPIYATHDGTATASYTDVYGFYVKIVSPLGFQTWYGHMLIQNIPATADCSSFSLFTGSHEVKAGDLLGYMNGAAKAKCRGASTGTHLHYELRGPRGLNDPEYQINDYVPHYDTAQAGIKPYPPTLGCMAKDAGGSITPPGGS